MKRKLFSVLLSVAMVATLLVGCGKATDTTKDADKTVVEKDTAVVEKEADTAIQKIGVAMPTKDLQRWNQDGSNMEAELIAAGYEVDLQYASNDIQTQVSQIENMISNGCNLLVIASIDGDSLGTVLAQAKEAGIPVIAYDRLIMNSDAVTYYATFDNYMVGTKQGEYIVKALDLDNAAGPFNLEVITGDPGDNNAKYFYNGAMDILKQYVDSGKLVVQSGQVDFAKVATANWATDAAQSRFDNILATYYSGGTKLDVVLASNDSTALGVANSIEANYDITANGWPVLTGQDCDIANVKNMIAGKQSMSIFKDTRTLATQVVAMVDAVMKGGEAPVNDTKSYDNGTGIIPSYLCEPVFADVDNYTKLLIDSGYYAEADLK
ncbi:MAG TPA: multiple monosaccharide ABC transporter substrate-binding protein [Lachnospiraceae bacterium]|nr:multiple monosaccharide ABC transporter substrate-binding protein [Lachnospiraceae bacterium]